MEIDEDLPWKKLRNWMHCICVVTFDLELGQALENVFPSATDLSKQEISNLCYLAFPDSNSGCMGDTHFIIRLQCSFIRQLSKEHVFFNTKCPPMLQINPSYFWGYVYFRQVRDPTLPRGYFQKSLVILSHLPFDTLFRHILDVIAPIYFERGNISLEHVCKSINQWAAPTPGATQNNTLFGCSIQLEIPENMNRVERDRGYVPEGDNRVRIPIDNLKIFPILLPVLSHMNMLWELVLTAEPLVIMAPSPTICSNMVLALTRIIAPLKYCGDYRPFFTIHDSEFKQFTNSGPVPPPVILRVTNPFFAKALRHWPHSMRLDDKGKSSFENQVQKYKRNNNTRMLDNSPGLFTDYKPFLIKDPEFMQKLQNGSTWQRPPEVQTMVLKKYFLELTQSFMIPLERYVASLMPLQRYISPFKAAPQPLPFNQDDFFPTLEAAGPQLTTGIRGDWVELYKKFFRSPNFDGWFNNRYSELYAKLQTLHLEALAEADLHLWVQGRPEVEIVDMVLKIKNNIDSYKEQNLPISDRVKEQLNQKLQDIMGSLPDDLKNILSVP